MYNWSVDTTKLKKNSEKYAIFELEQLINFGLNKEKISKKQLKKYWLNIEIDPSKRSFLEKLLW